MNTRLPLPQDIEKILSEDLMAALRDPGLLSQVRYGDAVRIYLHEQAHLERKTVIPHKLAYEDLHEDLADLWAIDQLEEMARQIGYSARIAISDVHRREREWVNGLLQYAPEGSAQVWRQVDGEQLVRQVAALTWEEIKRAMWSGLC